MPIISAIGGNAQKAYGFSTGGPKFEGGNLEAASLKDAAEFMVTADATAPTSGGTLTINSTSVASYDWCKIKGDHTVSAFNAATYFTGTQDSRSAFILFDGNLTINSGQTFIPSVRKLFTVIYVKKNLTLNGTISMSARGANHSSSGGSNISPPDIRIANGTYSGVSNPQIPSAGAASNASGSAGQTGGGGHGSNGFAASGAAGRAGTSFTGGTGGSGGCDYGNGNPGVIWGGPGGCQSYCGGTGSIGGGAGNPGGCGCGHGGAGQAGGNGTGGVLVIFVKGTYSGTGAVTASGVNGGLANVCATGGGSGGGSITIFCGVDSGPTPSAPGGAMRGGSGTARKLAYNPS